MFGYMDTQVRQFFNIDLAQHSHRLLGLAFLALYVSVWDHTTQLALDTDTPALWFSYTMLAVHIGLFLLWQPFLQHTIKIKSSTVLVLMLSVLASLYAGGVWAQIVWCLFLIGMLSSYRLHQWQDRVIYFTAIILTMIHLFASLIPWVLLPKNDQVEILAVARYVALALTLILLLLPFKAGAVRSYSSDIFYAIFTVGVLIFLFMSTALWMAYYQYDYYQALIVSSLTTAVGMILISLIFRPESDVGLFSRYRDRYLLNLGTPFESFLSDIASRVNTTDQVNDFLNNAFNRLLELDWIQGFQWQRTADEALTELKAVGKTDGARQLIQYDELSVSLFSDQPLGPSLATHSRLLVYVVYVFYLAKLREQQLTERAHLAAIHETGARLTHDIKNLVQSLSLMLSTAQISLSQPHEQTVFLQNLGVISQRLQQTLSKLKNPRVINHEQVSLSAWYEQLTQRYTQHQIRFKQQLDNDHMVVREVLDTVMENLMDNAIRKQQQDATVNIDVSLEGFANEWFLTVTDTGQPVPSDQVAQLFSHPVESSAGFGIGLHQAWKQARQQGYVLSLKNNQTMVAFELHGKSR